jgi:adenine-specific DNA-methyltransferase
MRNRSLLAALSEIQTSSDLWKLFQLLGYRRDDSPAANGATVVARWKGFKIVATDSVTPQETARQIARELASSSERALAAVAGCSRDLSLAAPRFGRHGITKVLTVSVDHPTSFALQQLERLTPDDSSSALGHSLYVAEVLSSEEVGQRFFIGFRVILERMAASVSPTVQQADRQVLALLSLIRILFLYFVQAKGWLDGRRDFLRKLLDQSLARRRNFHRTSLLPLFFGTLNRPPEDRNKRSPFGTIPYLNGGLFEPHEVERRLGSICFANDLWRDAFDGLFEKFRFCVSESDEADAIAPDMLGRAFERLMDSSERQTTGTFYTPETVVRQIVNAAIETALTRALPQHVASAVVHQLHVSESNRIAAKREVLNLRILDPAVGSGAFLLGALQSLVDIHAGLEPHLAMSNVSRLKRMIIRDNLMGVDLNPIAVRLAELRLWLAVIADDTITDIHHVKPLPNLDGIVRQGDTLIDPLGASRMFGSYPYNTSSLAIRAVRAARRAMFDARGQAQLESLRELRVQEIKMARLLLDEADASIRRARDDLNAAARSRDLFGKRAGLSPAQRERHNRLSHIRQMVRNARGNLNAEQLPFFSFEVHAPDVVAEGGFSVVIGNPPWVRAERLPPAKRKALHHRFSWWRSDSKRGYAHLPDLSIAFLQRCLELARPGGAVGLLLPSKILSAGYSEIARRSMVRETSIAYLHRVSEREATQFGATTYPLAVVLKKKTPKRDHRTKLGFAGGGSIVQKSLDKTGPWLLLSSRSLAALDEFRNSGIALGRVAPPSLGVKTGANTVFIGTPIDMTSNRALVMFDDRVVVVERAMLRPAVRGRDVREFSVSPKHVILWTHGDTGDPLESLPPKALRYLKRHSVILRSRSDFRKGPLWTLFRVTAAVAPYRVVWSDIARHPRSVALAETAVSDAIPLNTCYVAAAPDRECALAIAATLNSTWSRVQCIVTADEARGGYRRINARVASDVPVPQPRAQRKALADFSLYAHTHTNVSINDLDEAVAEALGLSARTRKVLLSLAPNNC